MLPHEVGRNRCEDKAREGKRHPEQRVHDDKHGMETLNVQDMRLPHDMRRESRRHDQHHYRKDLERSRQTSKEDRKDQEKVRTDEGRTSSGKMRSYPTTKKVNNTGFPDLLRFYKRKSGRSVSPYTEKDDWEIDLNEMVAKLGVLGHVSAQDNWNRSSHQMFHRPEQLSQSARGARQIVTSSLICPQQLDGSITNPKS